MNDTRTYTYTHTYQVGDQPRYTFFTWYAVFGTLVLFATISMALAVVWATTTPGENFWPAWVIVVFASLLLMHVLLTISIHGVGRPKADGIRLSRLTDGRAGFEIVAGIYVSICAMLWGFWIIQWAGSDDWGTPWPIWPTLAFGVAFAIQGMFLAVLSGGERYREVVQHLTSSRAGVVEAQELELRRIERDLHDGAQARLVALNMQLGLAEQQLDKSPEKAKELLAEARANTTAALVELRDLARGIYPPVLADRGLVPAIESLVAVSPLEVSIDATEGKRLPAAIEGALYFTVAEAIANAGKHAQCTHVDVTLKRGDFDVVLTVTDDGRGGANPAGNGLVGIRQRIEALDGRLWVDSPTSGPTTIKAELPCAQ